MGIDIHTFVTSYIKCKKKKKSVKVETYICSNKKCKLFNKDLSSPYCPSCGQKHGIKTTVEEVPAVDPSDIEYVSKKFYCIWAEESEYDIFVCGNQKGLPVGFPSFEPMHIDSFAEKIDYESIPFYIKWFKKNFKKEIEIFEKAYGKDNVTVEFGLVHHVF